MAETHSGAFQERLKAVSGLSVNRTVDRLAPAVTHKSMQKYIAEFTVAEMFVGRD
jgi:hypothetical protein